MRHRSIVSEWGTAAGSSTHMTPVNSLWPEVRYDQSPALCQTAGQSGLVNHIANKEIWLSAFSTPCCRRKNCTSQTYLGHANITKQTHWKQRGSMYKKATELIIFHSNIHHIDKKNKLPPSCWKYIQTPSLIAEQSINTSRHKCYQDEFPYMCCSCWLNIAPSVHRDKQWWIKVFRAATILMFQR